jgi:uncharacterized surface protein with fasciclin (FAS1) repeats
VNKTLAATILVTAFAGLSACGSDNNASSVTAVRIDTSVSSVATSAPQTSVSGTGATETSVETTAGSTTQSTDDSSRTSTASSNDTNSTNLNIQSRMDEARAALKAGDFSTMLQALELSGLASDLEKNAITILAPTDAAFKDLSAGTVTSLLANPSEIDKVLKRHIIDEVLTFDELSKKTSVTMMSGDTLPVTNVNGVVKVDGGTVTETDTKLSGQSGQEVAVFAIDRVLLDS